MRAFLVLLAVAAASAAPQMFYSSPLVKPLTYIQAKPFEYELKQEGAKIDLQKVQEKKATLQVNNAAFAYAATPFVHSSIYSNVFSPYKVIAKREAEADPALMVYGQQMPYTAAAAYNMMGYKTPLAYAASPLAYSAPIAHPVAYKANAFPMVYAAQPAMYKVKSFSDDRASDKEYAAKGMYKAETEGSIHIAKREAEPFMMYSHINTMPYAAAGMPYNMMAYKTPLAYSASPLAYAASPIAHAVAPVMYKKPSEYLYVEQEEAQKEKFINPAERVFDNALEKDAPEYASKGMYKAENAGAVHIAKREAEPFMVYSNGQAINTFPYAAYNTFGYNNLAYQYQTPLAYKTTGYNWPYVY